MRPKLIAFGNVLLDFTYCVEKNPDILSEYGFQPNGLGECSSEQLLSVRKKAGQTCEFLSSQTGGSALNTSKILSLLGERENVFCGAIGNDDNGTVVRQQLEESGLKSCLQVAEGHPTGTCVCLINKENRCCYGNIGASIYFDKEFLLTQDLIEPCSDAKFTVHSQIYYVEGFFITENRFSLCKYIIDDVCTPSTGLRIFAANLSAEYIIEMHPDQMKYIAEHASILFGNRSEFKKLAEIYQMSSASDLIGHLINMKSTENVDKIIICTQGSDCVLYSSRFQMLINKEFHFKSVPKEQIVDTTGCGDAFVAGFFYAFLQTKTIEECVGNGINVALNKITSVGGTFSN